MRDIATKQGGAVRAQLALAGRDGRILARRGSCARGGAARRGGGAFPERVESSESSLQYWPDRRQDRPPLPMPCRDLAPGLDDLTKVLLLGVPPRFRFLPPPLLLISPRRILILFSAARSTEKFAR